MIARETLDRLDQLLAKAAAVPWEIIQASLDRHEWLQISPHDGPVAIADSQQPEAQLIVLLANNAEGLVAAAREAADLQAETAIYRKALETISNGDPEATLRAAQWIASQALAAARGQK